jgi:hypothetical protein
VIHGLGSAKGDLMTIGILAVKKTERIFLKSCLAGIAKAINITLEVINKSLSVCRSAFLTADRVHVELYVLQAETAKNRVSKRNSGSIGCGAL